jgi:CHASE2 domain-containing sensor protein
MDTSYTASMLKNSNPKKGPRMGVFREKTDLRRPGFILVSGLVLTLAWAVAVWTGPAWLKSLDYMFFDVQVRMKQNTDPSSRIVLVDIDEESLSAVGQWPWPRYRMAAMISTLAVNEPAVIAMDIIFSEPDRTSWTSIQQAFNREFGLEVEISGLPRDMKDHDAYFGHVLTRAPTVGAVILFYQHQNTDSSCRILPLNIQGDVSFLDLPQASGLLCNIPFIQAGLARSGFINTTQDEDGVLRRLPLIAEYQGSYFPSLALASLMLALNQDEVTIENDLVGPVLRSGGISIPMDHQGRTLMRFDGPGHDFQYLSARDVLTGNFDPALLQDKIIFIGSSAAGLYDLYYTARHEAMPGIQAHATLAKNALTGNHFREPVWTAGYELSSTILTGITITLLLSMSGSLWGGLGAIAAVIIFPVSSMIFLGFSGTVLPAASPVLAGGSILALLSFGSFIIEKTLARIRLEKLLRFKQAILELLVGVAEKRDLDTGDHIRRTQNFVKVLAGELSRTGRYSWINAHYIEALYLCAPLHDLGKIAIPDNILLKPGKLTEEEFTLMKEHVQNGKQIIDMAAQSLENEEFLELGAEMIMNHHEKWDGSGYPRGLAGEEIPLPGRIMALADVYDALISPRVYKRSMSHAQTRDIILKGSGTHFDPEVIRAFLQVEQEFIQIAGLHQNTRD